MKSTSHAFKQQATIALHDERLQRALGKAKGGFINKRQAAIDALPVFGDLRKRAKEIKNHTLEHLDFYLERFEQQVEKNGGQVHWAEKPEDARQAIIDICRSVDAKKVTKGKSMVSEEIALNQALEEVDVEVVETDLGEYIIQLAKEPPSHIIAPAVHKTREEISDLFHDKHGTPRLEEVPELVNEARQMLREQFISADVGITGANFLIAETGSTIIVTNEGNGDLTASLPKVHIVITSIEKIVPTLEDVTTLIRLLGRSATGQEITSYTSFFTGKKRDTDIDGPEQFHVVLLDNGRSEMLGNEFREMLRCIRCGACMNHCPVYGSVGGHAYGWVYPGPMGSVLTPLMTSLEESSHLPNASTFCGRCAEVCPMSIPLPDLLRQHRIREYDQGLQAPRAKWALKLWAFIAKRPRLYHFIVSKKIRVLSWLGKKSGRFSYMPFATGWTKSRDLPAPQGETFLSAWKKQQGDV